MALTRAEDKKLSILMGSSLPLDHRIHKTECFMLKGFFHNNLPPNIQTQLMREDIKDPRKLVAKADETSFKRCCLQHSSSMPPPRPAPCTAFFAAPCPAPLATHPPAQSSSQNSDQCWYHCNHGDQAQPCCFPCSSVPGN